MDKWILMDTLWILFQSIHPIPIAKMDTMDTFSIYGYLKNDKIRETTPPSLIEQKYPEYPAHSEKVSISQNQSIHEYPAHSEKVSMNFSCIANPEKNQIIEAYCYIPKYPFFNNSVTVSISIREATQ